MNEDFIWTDELVNEFIEFKKNWGSFKPVMEAFKEEKSKLNSSNKDWEIVEVKSKGSNLILPFVWDTEIGNNGWEIYSVKRLSDGEVFSVGDKVESDNTRTIYIDAFCIMDNRVMAVKGGTYATTLNEIKKAKQPLFTKEQVIGIIEKILTLNK